MGLYFGRALSGDGRIVEDQIRRSGQSAARIGQGVSGNTDRARVVLHHERDAARAVTGSFQDLHPCIDLIALAHLSQPHPLQYHAGIRRGCPVVGVRRRGVAALVRAYQYVRVLKQIDVEHMVPVGVGEHDHIDVRGPQSPLFEAGEQ